MTLSLLRVFLQVNIRSKRNKKIKIAINVSKVMNDLEVKNIQDNIYQII